MTFLDHGFMKMFYRNHKIPFVDESSRISLIIGGFSEEIRTISDFVWKFLQT